MPGPYLKQLGEEMATVVHRLANETSVVMANVDFLAEHAPRLEGDCADALKDAVDSAKRLADAVRRLQELIG